MGFAKYGKITCKYAVTIIDLFSRYDMVVRTSIKLHNKNDIKSARAEHATVEMLKEFKTPCFPLFN